MPTRRGAFPVRGDNLYAWWEEDEAAAVRAELAERGRRETTEPGAA